ncbi:MAG: hypothetical protein P1U56_26330, partial [Saprospiraceae bacterium]|nr:hypothetical protein [Saprospiraceae bacterium]
IDSRLSNQGTGGMQSKLEAAEIAQQNAIETWIINGHEDSFLLNALDEKSRFSRIKSSEKTKI